VYVFLILNVDEKIKIRVLLKDKNLKIKPAKIKKGNIGNFRKKFFIKDIDKIGFLCYIVYRVKKIYFFLYFFSFLLFNFLLRRPNEKIKFIFHSSIYFYFFIFLSKLQKH